MADLQRFSFIYTKQGNQASEVFVWSTASPDVVVNVDFTQEGMECVFLDD